PTIIQIEEKCHKIGTHVHIFSLSNTELVRYGKVNADELFHAAMSAARQELPNEHHRTTK
ncbi:MAG: hypothetical protein ACFFEU_00450, partial [Candidatus Thorarchaeota archaeon]